MSTGVPLTARECGRPFRLSGVWYKNRNGIAGRYIATLRIPNFVQRRSDLPQKLSQEVRSHLRDEIVTRWYTSHIFPVFPPEPLAHRFFVVHKGKGSVEGDADPIHPVVLHPLPNQTKVKPSYPFEGERKMADGLAIGIGASPLRVVCNEVPAVIVG